MISTFFIDHVDNRYRLKLDVFLCSQNKIRQERNQLLFNQFLTLDQFNHFLQKYYIK